MRERKAHNTSTSINNEGFGGGDIEYVSDFMRSYDSHNLNGAEARDPFQDLKRAKALKAHLQKSQIDLGSGFGGAKLMWITDKQAGQMKVDQALASGEFKGRNPGDDKKKAIALKKYVQERRRAYATLGWSAPPPGRCSRGDAHVETRTHLLALTLPRLVPIKLPLFRCKRAASSGISLARCKQCAKDRAARNACRTGSNSSIRACRTTGSDAQFAR